MTPRNAGYADGDAVACRHRGVAGRGCGVSLNLKGNPPPRRVRVTANGGTLRAGAVFAVRHGWLRDKGWGAAPDTDTFMRRFNLAFTLSVHRIITRTDDTGGRE